MRHPDHNDEWESEELLDALDGEQAQQLRVQRALEAHVGRMLDIRWHSDPWGQRYCEARVPGHQHASYIASLNGELVYLH